MNPLHKAHGDLRGFSYFIVDDDTRHWYPVESLENQEIDKNKDYAINMGRFVSYIATSPPKLIPFDSNNLLFRKGKIYPFRDGKVQEAQSHDIVVASDELGNKFNMSDVWHSLFYFIKEEDLLAAERFLKLKRLG